MKRAARSLLLAAPLAVVACDAPAATPGIAKRAPLPQLLDGPAVKDVPAVDAARFPDSVGYVYEGPLAKVLWLQNVPSFRRLDRLEAYLRGVFRRGVAGEFLSSQLQPVSPLPAEPDFHDIAKASLQATLLTGQYANVAHDYSRSLGTAVGQYNADATRQAAVSAAAARVTVQLQALEVVGPVPSVPTSAPDGPPMLRTAEHFPEGVLLAKQRYLTATGAALERAIAARDLDEYAETFTEVFSAQLDPALRDLARDELGRHHDEGVLRGQPLDRLILHLVPRGEAQGAPLSLDQLLLVNRINLRSHATAELPALVTALLLLQEDRRQAQSDASLSCFKIWAHRQDQSWLVSEYLRLKGGGTAEEVASTVANLIANIGSL